VQRPASRLILTDHLAVKKGFTRQRDRQKIGAASGGHGSGERPYRDACLPFCLAQSEHTTPEECGFIFYHLSKNGCWPPRKFTVPIKGEIIKR
jgi:hypothetical protein